MIGALIQALQENYIIADLVDQIAGALSKRLHAGGYDSYTAPADFCVALSEHLLEMSHDKHLRVCFSPQPPPAQGASPQSSPEDWFATFLRLHNYGFQKVERLAGQVGYIELRGFAPPKLAGEIAIAAMALVANTEALLFDLRACPGGDAGMVTLIASYLFPHPTHLNTMHWRENDRLRQYWTAPYVPGSRYIGKEVYVLTSAQTFSAAEEFAYDLQQLKRATVVGEVTGGGAHPTERFALAPHIIAHIPIARSVNPISGTNWEQRGVQPDIAVAAEQALETAHRLALQSILERHANPKAGPYADFAREVRDALAAIKAQP